MVCIFANGMKENYPTAIVESRGKNYIGKTEAVVVESLVKDLIVGPSLY